MTGLEIAGTIGGLLVIICGFLSFVFNLGKKIVTPNSLKLLDIRLTDSITTLETNMKTEITKSIDAVKVSYSAELQKMKTEHIAAINAINANNSNLSDVVDEHDRSISDDSSNISDIQKQISGMEINISIMRTSIQKVTEEIATQSGNNSSVLSSLNMVTYRLDLLDKAVSKITDDVKIVQHSNIKLETDMQNQKNTINSSMDEFTSVMTEYMDQAKRNSNKR